MNEFEKAAADQAQSGFFGDYWYFLCHNKKWWLAPLVLLLLAFGFLTLLGGSAAAPFIYTFF